MKIQLSQSEICLSKRQTLSLEGGVGVRIDAREGTLWLTQDNDLRDVVLHAGESFTLDGKGMAIVQAFEASRLGLSQPGKPGRRQHPLSWELRLSQLFRRVLPQTGWA